MKWINVAEQKPPFGERVLVYYRGNIRTGCWRDGTLPKTDEIKTFVDEYAIKVVDQGDEKLRITIQPCDEKKCRWDIDGDSINNWDPKPTFWMPLPYEPVEIKGLA